MRPLTSIAAARRVRGRVPQVFSGGGGGIPTRTPSPYDVLQIHSGHSLTDTFINPGPHPGLFANIIGTQDSAAATYLGNNDYASTVPGSEMYWRRDGDNVDESRKGEPPAYDILDQYEILNITERNDQYPDSLYPDPDGWIVTLKASRRAEIAHWYDRALTLGDGGTGMEFLWYTCWPNFTTDVPPAATWRERLGANETEWLELADYAMGQHGGYIYIVPGNALMMRLWDDAEAGLIPGITDGADFLTQGNRWWSDNVHPNGLGSLAVAYMHALVMFHLDPRGLQSAFGLSPDPTAAEATYIQDTVYDLCINYPRSGVPTLP